MSCLARCVFALEACGTDRAAVCVSVVPAQAAASAVAGPRVFLLSGWGALPDAEFLYFPQLSARLRASGATIFPSRHACSDGDIARHVGNLAALVEEAGGLGPDCFFVGQSIGGQIIARYLASRPAGARAGGAVWIGAWLSLRIDMGEAMKPWLDAATLDFAALATACPRFLALYSTDDPISGAATPADLGAAFPAARVRVASGRGHYIVQELTAEELAAIDGVVLPA